MDFGQIPLMATLHTRMQYMGARQAMLAQNIANADTPGYVARDLKAPDFSRTVSAMHAGQGVGLWRTNPMHMSSAAQNNAFQVIHRKPTAEDKPNGNQVSIEDEVERMSMNQDDYGKVTSLYRNMISMFNTAIGKSGGS